MKGYDKNHPILIRLPRHSMPRSDSTCIAQLFNDNILYLYIE